MSADRKPGPNAVTCPQHGTVFLTDAEYDEQIGDPEHVWICPLCGAAAPWDDVNWDLWNGTPGPDEGSGPTRSREAGEFDLREVDAFNREVSDEAPITHLKRQTEDMKP